MNPIEVIDPTHVRIRLRSGQNIQAVVDALFFHGFDCDIVERDIIVTHKPSQTLMDIKSAVAGLIKST